MIRLCGLFIERSIKPVSILSLKQNINRSFTSVNTVQGSLIKRKASTSLAGPASESAKNEQKISPLGWFLLLIPITTFGLGCWQLKRKAWKEQLIKDLEMCTKAPPVPLPEDLSSLNDMEYRAVKVKGKFLHNKEMLMGPRSYIRPDGVKTMAGLISKRDGSNGYCVVTPFKLADRDDIILINRGWISRQNKKPETRLAGQVKGEVELTCIVRKGEEKPRFAPESRGDLFLYRDLNKMCALTGAQPVFLDACYDSTAPGGPIGGQTNVFLRNEHLSYVVTWYCLSLATAIIWYRTIVKGKPAF